MGLAEITETMKTRVGADCGIAKIIKFDFGTDGIVRIDGASKPNSVDNDDSTADCTIKVTMADFMDIADGKQNAQMMFMMGKLKVEGDMSIAMQIGKILG